jgi:hypothetical protein
VILTEYQGVFIAFLNFLLQVYIDLERYILVNVFNNAVVSVAEGTLKLPLLDDLLFF